METDLETERRAQILLLRTSHARLLQKAKALIEAEESEFGSHAWQAVIGLSAAVLGSESAEKWHQEIVKKTSEAVKEKS